MADAQLKATKRTEFGKGAARRTRRSGLIPAVVYGHGIDPIHVVLPSRETTLVLRNANALLEIAIEGEKKPIMAIAKQVQRDPLSNNLDHVDLLLVREGQKVTVEVSLSFVGEAPRDAMVNTDINVLAVEAPVINIPSEIEVSLEGMEIGDSILVGDLKLPEGVSTSVDPETLVVNIVPPPTVQLEAEEEPAEETEEAAEEAEEEADDAE
ncbi:MAG: 50S ribosomal protein L25/general stress protein Ctc [Arachnia propionica]|nr:MAG: 50S ribosomal protein L25/general stress protein Ctc [Arachnia propionica]